MIPDYAAMRVEYVHGTATTVEIATAHGISPAGLRKRATDEGWPAERRRISQKVAQIASDALLDSRSATLAKFNADDVRVAARVKARVSRMLERTTLTPQDLRALAGALDSAQKVGRLALGASTENAAMALSGEVRIAQSSELAALSTDELRELLRLTRKVGGGEAAAAPLTLEMAE